MAVGAEMEEERRGSDCSMTGATEIVSWVDQWLWARARFVGSDRPLLPSSDTIPDPSYPDLRFDP